MPKMPPNNKKQEGTPTMPVKYKETLKNADLNKYLTEQQEHDKKNSCIYCTNKANYIYCGKLICEYHWSIISK